MKIKVNGKVTEVKEGTTLSDLLAAIRADSRRVVTEVNRKIISREARQTTGLREGDEVEVVTFVGGG